jgi:hypothetical protein
MAIKSVPYSFVRFEDLTDAYCNGEAEYKLPAYLKHNEKFQFIVDSDLTDTVNILLGVNGSHTYFTAPVLAQILSYKHKLSLGGGLSSSFLLVSFAIGTTIKTYNLTVTIDEFIAIINDDFGINVSIVSNELVFVYDCKLPVELIVGSGPTTYNTVSYFWHQGYAVAPDYYILGYDPTFDTQKLKCFQYSLHIEATNIVLGLSNLFTVLETDCYYSKITYSCNENAFGFIYGGLENSNWLPVYLSRPTHPQKRTVYVKSNGRQVLLSANVEKEYLLQTDHMTELFHECMAIAMSHDNIKFENGNIREKAVEVISSDNYTPDWNNEFELITCQGKTKIKVASFGETNSNCGSDNCGATGVCGAPTGLSIGSITSNSAIASWISPGGLSQTAEIILHRADTPGTPVSGYPQILAPGATNHTFTGLEDGTAYQFSVRYHCGATQSAWINLPADPDFETLP